MGIKHSKNELTKIDKRIIQTMAEKGQSGQVKLKAFNSIIMKFPKIDKSFEEVKNVFKKYDKDNNASIDLKELRLCFEELQVNFSEEEIQAFHKECDMNSSSNIEFKEFVVVLALVYLLGSPTSQSSESTTNKSRIGLPILEQTFDTIVEAFLFFDQDHDGFITKEELVAKISESALEKGSSLGVERFEEMDWSKDGRITFKEFLFAFTDWVGVEDEIEEK